MSENPSFTHGAPGDANFRGGILPPDLFQCVLESALCRLVVVGESGIERKGGEPRSRKVREKESGGRRSTPSFLLLSRRAKNFPPRFLPSSP